jgi:geranylgeranyl pyrophosphate synthase
MQCAMAIEYIHASSLVMDDIMDDDDYRRGKMSLHIRYNSTIAQLAAILLFSIGLENIFDGLDKLQKEKPDANKNISLLIGNIFSKLLHELIIGQYLDVSMPDNVFSQDKIKGIENVIHKKTSSLFEYSFVIPWILANYNKSDEELEKGIKNMTDISRKFGLMFQISDDFEDYIQDKEKSDSNMTMNYVINLGYSDAYKEYNKIVQDFKLTASNENILTKELSEIEGYLTKKVDVYYNQNYKIKKIDY